MIILDVFFSSKEGIPVIIMLMFCSEGDNAPDALSLAYHVNDWLGMCDFKVSNYTKDRLCTCNFQIFTGTSYYACTIHCKGGIIMLIRVGHCLDLVSAFMGPT